MSNEELLNQLADMVEKRIQKERIFPPGGVPVEVASRVYGKSALWVRTGILEGWLPIGHATQSDHRTNIYISPKKLYEDTGYIYEG